MSGTSGSYQRPGGRVEHATAVTGPGGEATLVWPPGAFSAPPVVTLAVAAGAGFRSVRIVSNTAAATVVEAVGAAVVELLGVQILAVGAGAAGVTVLGMATPAAP